MKHTLKEDPGFSLSCQKRNPGSWVTLRNWFLETVLGHNRGLERCRGICPRLCGSSLVRETASTKIRTIIPFTPSIDLAGPDPSASETKSLSSPMPKSGLEWETGRHAMVWRWYHVVAQRRRQILVTQKRVLFQLPPALAFQSALATTTCTHRHAHPCAQFFYISLPVGVTGPGDNLDSFPRNRMSTNCTIPAWVGPVWLHVLTPISGLIKSLSHPFSHPAHPSAPLFHLLRSG